MRTAGSANTASWADEFDSTRGLISMDSPMAHALMKKCEGDEVIVKRPKGEAVFTIVKVRYEPFR